MHHNLLARRLGDQFLAGIVLYSGGLPLSFGERLHAWPISSLWTLGPGESWSASSAGSLSGSSQSRTSWADGTARRGALREGLVRPQRTIAEKESATPLRSQLIAHRGLEFDLVVLIDPEAFGTGIEGAVDRYVAMTRATQQLVILTSSPGAATQPSAGCAVLGVERVSVAGGVHRAGRGDRT
jgi:hypothetical protein